MPELPEVETIKNELAPYVVGKTVTRIIINSERIIQKPLSVEDFLAGVTGATIKDLKRWGKYLLFSLDTGDTLVMHMRMTGSLWVKSVDIAAERYVKALIYLDDELVIHFRDPRELGRMWLVKDASEITDKLGPEPLGRSFTPEVLAECISKRKAPVKTVLLDQSAIAGVGNMYADEALFRANIHPRRPASSLTAEEFERLHRAIRQVLRAGILNKGASVENYYRPSGETGFAHEHFQVAHRLGGKLCPICSTPIERTVIGQRGTYFCPRCQPAKLSKRKKNEHCK